MTAYKEPGFQDRRAAAAKARDEALARLKAKPPLDPEVVAERAAREQKREADAKLRAEQKIAERAAQVKAAETSEADLKAARDARYAARKARRS